MKVKWITLTCAYSGKPIALKIKKITAIVADENRTRIVYKKEQYYSVTESVEYISRLISPDGSLFI
jgi:hypothetical protein